MLTGLPLLENSDDFVFDNQMLAQCVHFGFRIGEVSCPTKYFEEASSINFRRSVQVWAGRAAHLGAVPPCRKSGWHNSGSSTAKAAAWSRARTRYYSPEVTEKRSPAAGPAANVAKRTRIPHWDFVEKFALVDLFLLASFAMLVQGYHPGLEDDAFYLAAIKHDLNPALFPHDADFFRVQFQATIFDKLIAFLCAGPTCRWNGEFCSGSGP